MPGKQELCQQCGSILKTDVCLKCGFDPEVVLDNIPAQEDFDENVSHEIDAPEQEAAGDHQQVQSIFSEMAAASGGSVTQSLHDEPVKNRVILPIMLSLVLFMFAGAAYWRFVHFTPDYVSPLVLAAVDLRGNDSNGTDGNTDLLKTIELESNLETGNFEANDFAQFGATSTTAFIKAFNLKNVFEVFGTSSEFAALQTEFDISDDDFNVYFSKGFAYFVPGENLDTWGLAIGVNNKNFIETRITNFEKKKAAPNYAYSGYHVELVELDLPQEATPSAETTSDNKMFLLVSNSNEYVDQMKEASEGNLNNLAKEIKFVNSKVDLPKVGEVFVYKNKDSQIWNILSDIAASKYSYVGLDKILKAIQSTGVAFFSVDDSKLRISLSKN